MSKAHIVKVMKVKVVLDSGGNESTKLQPDTSLLDSWKLE
jgi:hypothetical protein